MHPATKRAKEVESDIRLILARWSDMNRVFGELYRADGRFPWPLVNDMSEAVNALKRKIEP